MTTLTIDDQKFIIEEGPIITGPSHTIRTIKDMLTVVKPESLDDFLVDLKQVFQLWFSMKEYNIPVMEQFDWFDDGKHDINVNCTVSSDPLLAVSSDPLLAVVGTNEEKSEILSMMKDNFYTGVVDPFSTGVGEECKYSKVNTDEENAVKMMKSGDY